jgi:hypothetical protein
VPEAQLLIEPDRGRVGGHRVQERDLAAGPDPGTNRPDQPGGQPPAAPRLVGADRADLGPARRVQPLPGHGHQRAIVTDAQVRAELERPPQERAWPGAPGEVKHLRHVRRAEHHRLGISGDRQAVAGHLHTLTDHHDLPAGRRRNPDAGQRQQAAWPDQPRGVRPVSLVRLVGHGEERAHIDRVTHDVAALLSELGMRPGQRREHRVVERMRHRHRPPICC